MEGSPRNEVLKNPGEKKDADVNGAKSTVLPELLVIDKPYLMSGYRRYTRRFCSKLRGCSYCATSDGTLAFSSDKLSRSKKAKECVTALVIWMAVLSVRFWL